MEFNQHNYQIPTYHNLQHLFSLYQYTTTSLISKQKLTQILNSQSKKVLNRNVHEPIIDEIWQQAETTSKGEATVHTIIQVILQAVDILGKRITQIKGTQEDGIDGLLIQKRLELQQKKMQLQENEQYYADHAIKLNKLRKQLIEIQFEENQLENDLGMFQEEHKTLCLLCSVSNLEGKQVESQFLNEGKAFASKSIKFNPYTSSYYQQRTQQKNSKGLLVIFHLTNVLFFLQFFASSYRLPMLALLFYLHSYYIVFIGFQQNSVVTYFIIQGVVSILFDIGFLVLKIGNHAQLMPFIHHSNYTYSAICFIFLGITLILRGILIFFYSRYLDEENLKTRDYFTLMGQKIYLNHGVDFQKKSLAHQSRLPQRS